MRTQSKETSGWINRADALASRVVLHFASALSPSPCPCPPVWSDQTRQHPACLSALRNISRSSFQLQTEGVIKKCLYLIWCYQPQSTCGCYLWRCVQVDEQGLPTWVQFLGWGVGWHSRELQRNQPGNKFPASNMGGATMLGTALICQLSVKISWCLLVRMASFLSLSPKSKCSWGSRHGLWLQLLNQSLQLFNLFQAFYICFPALSHCSVNSLRKLLISGSV